MVAFCNIARTRIIYYRKKALNETGVVFGTRNYFRTCLIAEFHSVEKFVWAYVIFRKIDASIHSEKTIAIDDLLLLFGFVSPPTRSQKHYFHYHNRHATSNFYQVW